MESKINICWFSDCSNRISFSAGQLFLTHILFRFFSSGGLSPCCHSHISAPVPTNVHIYGLIFINIVWLNN